MMSCQEQFDTAMRLPGILFLLVTTAAGSHAAQIMLSNSSLIGGSGSWHSELWDSTAIIGGGLNAFHIVDNQTGTISESAAPLTHAGNYWLGRQGTLNEHLVIDLGDSYYIDQIDLFNTHDTGWNDRGTKDFKIFASNSVTLVNANVDYNLTGAIELLSGTLTNHWTSADPIEADTFAVNNGGNAYRYLRFEATNYYIPAGGPANQGAGLNEIRVFGTPEPSRMVLLSLGVGTLILRRRRAA